MSPCVVHVKVRRIAYYSIKTARHHDVLELGIPVEDINDVALLLVQKAHLLVVIKVGADEGVAALNVVA